MDLESFERAAGGTTALLRLLLDHLPVGVAWLDASGNVRAHNGELAQIVGGKPGRLEPFGIELDTPLDGSGGDVLCRRPDGTSRWVRVTSVPFGDDASGSGALVLVADVGERSALEAIAQQVIGVVAHDLRNPLSALKMTASLLARPTEMPTSRRVQLAERLLGTLGRMDGLIATLVEHARAEIGVPLTLDAERVDLGAIFERSKKDMAVLYPGRELVERRIGALGGLWDAARIERVLSNLMSNAFKHGSDSGVVTVVLDGSAPGVVTISVHNTGPAIPPEICAQPFRPFAIGPPGSEGRRRAIGLGLYIVGHLVTAHGGKLSVHSTGEEGTTVTVTLPRGLSGPAPATEPS